MEFITRHWLHLLPGIPIVIFIIIDLLARRKKTTSPTQSTIFQTLMPYGRRIVFTIVLVWAAILYYIVATSYPTVSSALQALQRYFGLTALTLLYLVLLPGIIRVYFPNFSGNAFLIKIRRAIGVSLFGFVLFHVLLGFFNNLSGSIPAVFLLPTRNQQAILFGFVAFIIFLSMALTSFDAAVRRLGGKRWKMLHRLVYLAGILVIFHAFFIGSHFTNPKNPIPLLVNFTSLTIILLEIGATLKRLSQNKSKISESRFAFSWIALSCLALVAVYFSYLGITQNPFDPHAEHMVAKGAEYELRVTTNPETIDPREDAEVTISVIDSKNGRVVSDFTTVHEKIMHLIVIKSDLSSYQHLHPEKRGDAFVQDISFPDDGVYNLFVEFQENGKSQGIAKGKQQVGLGVEEKAALTVTPLTRNFGDYQVAMDVRGVTVGKTSTITFIIRDSRKGRPITDLEPYLGAFGHLVVVSEDTNSYLHVHPSETIIDQRQRGGPTVQFLTQFAKAGKYKLFLQFQHNGKIQLAEYVMDVK